MECLEAIQIALGKVNQALDEFKQNYPPPYLDKSPAGFAYSELRGCQLELRNLIIECQIYKR